MLWVSLCIGFLLAAPLEGASKTLDLSSQNKTAFNSFVPGCGWKCKVNQSDISNRITTALTAERGLLRFVVTYKRKIEDKCVRYSHFTDRSENITEHWQIWVKNNKLPTYADSVLRSFSSLIDASVEPRVDVFCALNFSSDSSDNETSYAQQLSPADHLENILRSAVVPNGELCNSFVKDNIQTCIKLSQCQFSEWEQFLLRGILILFTTVFIYIGPAVVCLFSATEVTHQGVQQIVVNGAGPVSFRSLIGNYFFSTDYTMWHLGRKFIMRVVLLPLPFLAPALFVDYLLYLNLLPQLNVLHVKHLFQPFSKVCYICYCIQAFYLHFLVGKRARTATKWCVLFPGCRENNEKPVVWICSHRELPLRMLTHLRAVRWCLTQCVKFVLLAAVFGFAFSAYFLLEDKPLHFLIRLLIFPLSFFILSPFQAIYSSLGVLWALEIIIALSSPITTLCQSPNLSLWQFNELSDIPFFRHYLLLTVKVITVVLDICMSCLAAFGVVFVLRSAAVGIMIILQITGTLVLSEENLPFVACFVLFCYFLCSSYRSFTKKYQDLTATLWKHYYPFLDKKLVRPNSQAVTVNHGCLFDDVPKIPKQLFVMACERLTPVKKGICKLILKIILIVAFLSILCSLVMCLDATPWTKCLVSFLAGSFPKVASIYFDNYNRRQKNLEVTEIDEKARQIVQDYLDDSHSPDNRDDCSRQRRFYHEYDSDDKIIGKFLKAAVVPFFISAIVYLSTSILRPGIPIRSLELFMDFINTWFHLDKLPTNPSSLYEFLFRDP